MKLRRSPPLNPALLFVAPALQVALILIFFLLMSTTFMLQPGIAVEVPKSPFLLKPQRSPAVVSVTAPPLPALFFDNPQMDAMAVQWNAMGLGLANAIKHKLVGMLSERLKADGVYVGQVMVLGAVKGTPFDTGNATLEAASIAKMFWDLYTGRSAVTVNAS